MCIHKEELSELDVHNRKSSFFAIKNCDKKMWKARFQKCHDFELLVSSPTVNHMISSIDFMAIFVAVFRIDDIR